MAGVSKQPRVQVLPIAEAATTDPHNVNKHTQRGSGLLANSLRKRGAFRSIASAGKGVKTPVVMAGNLTLEVAADAGFTEVVNVHVTGNQLVNVVRDDLEPGSAAAIALGLEDNEIGKQSYNPDIDILAAVMADPAMQALREEDEMLADMIATIYDLHYPKDKDEELLLDQAIQLLPAKEYMVVMCESAEEWQNLREIFNLQQVRRGGYKAGSPLDATGTQRVVHAKTLLELCNAHSNTK